MSWIRLHPSLVLGVSFYEVGSPFIMQAEMWLSKLVNLETGGPLQFKIKMKTLRLANKIIDFIYYR